MHSLQSRRVISPESSPVPLFASYAGKDLAGLSLPRSADARHRQQRRQLNPKDRFLLNQDESHRVLSEARADQRSVLNLRINPENRNIPVSALTRFRRNCTTFAFSHRTFTWLCPSRLFGKAPRQFTWFAGASLSDYTGDCPGAMERQRGV
jgi:hypothetical protein